MATNASEPRRVGLVLLDRDRVVEGDLTAMLGDEVELVATRVTLGVIGSAEHLRALVGQLGDAADRLAPSEPEVVGIACTSLIPLVGGESVAGAVRSRLPGVAVVDPLHAIADGLTALGARTVAIVSPYPDDLVEPMATWLAGRGTTVARVLRIPGSYDSYADVPPVTIVEAATHTGDVDAVVVACTGMPATAAVGDIEVAIGRPVVASNQALAWAVARHLGLERADGPGRLWSVNR